MAKEIGIMAIQKIVNQPLSRRMKVGSPWIDAHSVLTKLMRLPLPARPVRFEERSRLRDATFPGCGSALDHRRFPAAAEATPTRPEDHREDRADDADDEQDDSDGVQVEGATCRDVNREREDGARGDQDETHTYTHDERLLFEGRLPIWYRSASASRYEPNVWW